MTSEASEGQQHQHEWLREANGFSCTGCDATPKSLVRGADEIPDGVYAQNEDGTYSPAEPVPYHGIQFLKVRRMCGGGTWKVQDLIPRHIHGALICDALGIAIAWNGDWK